MNETVIWIVTLGFGILAAIFGTKYVEYYGKIKNVWVQVKELGDVLFKALEDKKLTKEELVEIVKEAKDVVTAMKNIVGK